MKIANIISCPGPTWKVWLNGSMELYIWIYEVEMSSLLIVFMPILKKRAMKMVRTATEMKPPVAVL